MTRLKVFGITLMFSVLTALGITAGRMLTILWSAQLYQEGIAIGLAQCAPKYKTNLQFPDLPDRIQRIDLLPSGDTDR